MIVGDRFERLLVHQIFPRSRRLKIKGKAICLCDCGIIVSVNRDDLLSGHTKSCGCLKNEIVAKRNFKHGMGSATYRVKEYSVWAGIKTRCYNQKASNYKYYGARGIRMYEKWKNSFEAFLKDVGICPGNGFTVDRKNNDGNYEPGNVKWSTHTEQMRNSEQCKTTLIKAIEIVRLARSGMPLKEIGKIYGLSKSGAGHIARGRCFKEAQETHL